MVIVWDTVLQVNSSSKFLKLVFEKRNKSHPKMMQGRMLARMVPRIGYVTKRCRSGLVKKIILPVSNSFHVPAGLPNQVMKRGLATSTALNTCGASRKQNSVKASKKHQSASSCQSDNCKEMKPPKTPCMKRPCPPPVPNCPLNDPCWHCPYTPPPCPKQAHRCCPKPPCVENPKEFKSVCCEKPDDPCGIKCDTCEKKPECCPCDPCQSNKKKDCCPADLQQKHLCNQPPPKRVLKRCERPGSCEDPCCPSTPCCPDPCEKRDPCQETCLERCPRPVIPDVCSELGIICGPEKECEFKQPEACPEPCDRKTQHLKKARKPKPAACCLDLDPDWPPKRPQCDAECLSPDPCNPCQQTCKEKRPFWDGL